MKTVTIHDQAYQFYDWQVLGEHTFRLAQKMIDKGCHFDRVIALAKGGLTFSRSLVDYLHVAELSSFQIRFYTGIGETAKTPVVIQSLPVSVKGEHVLVFDDIVDSGETLEMAVKYLNFHGVASITTASHLTKPWASMKPDFSIEETEAWVIFPYECRETIAVLTNMWRAKGDSETQIAQQLVQIGLPESEVALFQSLK